MERRLLERRFVQEFGPRARTMLTDWRAVCRATGIAERWGRAVIDASGDAGRVLSFCMGGASRAREDREIWIRMMTEDAHKYRRGAPIYLDGFCFRRSRRSEKKYDVFLRGARLCSFGASAYEQYRDAIGVFLAQDHMDPMRRANYFSRHGRSATRHSPKWFSHRYLW